MALNPTDLHTTIRQVIQLHGTDILSDNRLLYILSDYSAFDKLSDEQAIVKTLQAQGFGQLLLDSKGKSRSKWPEAMDLFIDNFIAAHAEFDGAEVVYISDSIAYGAGLLPAKAIRKKGLVQGVSDALPESISEADNDIQSENGNSDAEKAAWLKAKRINTIESYQAYRRNYPEGRYDGECKKTIFFLQKKRDWERACKSDTRRAYKDFVRKYPGGLYVDEARKRIRQKSFMTGCLTFVITIGIAVLIFVGIHYFVNKSAISQPSYSPPIRTISHPSFTSAPVEIEQDKEDDGGEFDVDVIKQNESEMRTDSLEKIEIENRENEADDKRWENALARNNTHSYLQYLKYDSPYAKHIEEAKGRLFTLYIEEASSCSLKGYFSSAKTAYENAMEYGRLSPALLEDYQKSCEESDYLELSASSIRSEEALKKFLVMYPNSSHCSRICGWLVENEISQGCFDEARDIVSAFPVALDEHRTPDKKWWMKYIKSKEREYKNAHRSDKKQ